MAKIKLLISFLFCMILIASFVSAPPTTINIRGTIYHNGGAYATGGIPVTLNNTNDFVYTRTNGQAAPHIDASYADTINGSAGDTLIVFAWNTTHYGTNTTSMTTPTTRTNVMLNTTRSSEINLTIQYPNNNSKFNASTIFNVNATLLAIGGIDATTCSATLSINNNVIIDSDDSLIHNLGDITLGSTKTTSWNLTGNLTGSSNLSIIASCASDEIMLDKLNQKSISNITIIDQLPPIINLEYPFNNTVIKEPLGEIIFRYNVSDSSNVSNCSLILDDLLNQTNNTIIKDSSLNFSTALDNANYIWYVNCTDIFDNTQSSGFFHLNITPNFLPYISNMQILSSIDLNAGSTRSVECNATITDNNGIDDIIIVNSTLFSSSVISSSIDDNNNHYTNSTCQVISSTTYSANYLCTHNLEYYTDPGNWSCNMSVIDNSSAFNSSNISTIVNELIAVDVTPSIIDYGELESGSNSISDFQVNITNLGNTLFNISVDGFAQTDGDGFAMNCTNGNIDISYEKYSIYPGITYTSMIDLTDTSTMIGNFTLQQRTNDTTYKNDKNYTYWKMGIPVAIRGACSGFVIFKTVN